MVALKGKKTTEAQRAYVGATLVVALGSHKVGSHEGCPYAVFSVPLWLIFCRRAGASPAIPPTGQGK